MRSTNWTKILLLGIVGWSVVAQYVYCDYDAQQYPVENQLDDQSRAYGAGYGEGGTGGAYGAEGGEGGDDRPRIKLNFGVHVPAMKIQLPRVSLPKITIRAKLKQPSRPSVINVPEFNLETQSKVSPPGSNEEDNNNRGSYNSNGAYGRGYNQQRAAAFGGYTSSSSSDYGNNGNGATMGASTYLTASTDNRDGYSSLSLSNQPDTVGSGGDASQSYGGNNRYTTSYNHKTTMPASDQMPDNYKSETTNHASKASNSGGSEDDAVVYNMNRLAANSITSNNPDRFRLDHLDQTRSSSMIELHELNKDTVIKPDHLFVHTSAARSMPQTSGLGYPNHYHHQPQQYRFHRQYAPNNKYNSGKSFVIDNSEFDSQKESRPFVQKISSPFEQVRNWFRSHY